MSVEADLFTALKGLVGNRMYRGTFPQSDSLMTWPAIRYSFISTVPIISVCGDATDATADIRLQIDLVDHDSDAAHALRAQVRTAMQAFTPPAINEGGFEQFDAETKTHRVVLEYVIYQ